MSIKLPNDTPSSIWSRLPSFVWIILILGGIALLIVLAIGLFTGLATIEGFASVLMILISLGLLQLTVNPKDMHRQKINPHNATGMSGFLAAVFVLFFAMMGLAIDQPGNPLYNKPIELLFCPDGTTLQRGVNVTNPVPGRTDVTQDFICLGQDGLSSQHTRPVKIEEIIAVRFGEYIVIGYLLLYLHRFISWLRYRRWLSRNPALAEDMKSWN